MRRDGARSRQCASRPQTPLAPLRSARPSRVPRLADPLCIGLPATRSDARVFSQVDAAAAAYEVPYDRHPAPGSRGLPLPRSIVEAMSFMAFARQQENLQPSNQDTYTHTQATRNNALVQCDGLGIHPSRFALAMSDVLAFGITVRSNARSAWRLR